MDTLNSVSSLLSAFQGQVSLMLFAFTGSAGLCYQSVCIISLQKNFKMRGQSPGFWLENGQFNE